VALPSELLRALRARRPSPREWRRVLAVHTADAGPGMPAVLGSWEAAADALVFTPRLPFVSGLRYCAAFDGDACAALAGWPGPAPGSDRLEFGAPGPTGEPTRVVRVSPAPAEVPANLLRLYVHFSRPMRSRGVGEHVRLEGSDGRPVPLAFVALEPGLWDPQRRRLTLLLHPGRIKRGVAPRERLGPVLREGETYRLVVEAALTDAAGRALAADFVHELRVGPADRRSPDPSRWRLTPPATPTAPVAVDLDEPLDEALLGRLVRVEDAGGRPVAGTSAVGAGGARWRFAPERPWPAGRYQVAFPPELEDRAGNRVDGLFDAAPGDPARRPAVTRIPFSVPPPAPAGDPIQ